MWSRTGISSSSDSTYKQGASSKPMIYSYERRIAMNDVDEDWKLNPPAPRHAPELRTCSTRWRFGSGPSDLKAGSPGLGDQQLERLF